MDSESSRLLKRAEFLKAVVEKEGLEWLPKEESPEQKSLSKTHTVDPTPDMNYVEEPIFTKEHKPCTCNPDTRTWCCAEHVLFSVREREMASADTYVNNRKTEEQQWRKELLDFLATPNMGISIGEHINHQELIQRFLNLRKKFLKEG